MVLIYREATLSGKTILVADSVASKLPTHHGHKLKCLNYQPQAKIKYLTNNTNQTEQAKSELQMWPTTVMAISPFFKGFPAWTEFSRLVLTPVCSRGLEKSARADLQEDYCY